jgi:hypothetical protein
VTEDFLKRLRRATTLRMRELNTPVDDLGYLIVDAVGE